MLTAHTDRQTQPTTIPEGQNWPRVKNEIKIIMIIKVHSQWCDVSGFWVKWMLLEVTEHLEYKRLRFDVVQERSGDSHRKLGENRKCRGLHCYSVIATSFRFYQRLSKVSANERGHYICNIFPYWQRQKACPEKKTKKNKPIVSFCWHSLYKLFILPQERYCLPFKATLRGGLFREVSLYHLIYGCT